MSNLIPLSRLKGKGAGKLGLGSLLSGQNNLLPILFIFMSGKKGASFGNLNNILDMGNVFKGISSKFNLSNDNIAKSLDILSAVGPLGASRNAAMVSKFSTFLNAVYKMNTLKNYGSNINNNTSGDNDVNDVEQTGINTNIKMVEAIEQLLGDNMKEPVGKAKNMLGMYRNFKNATNTYKEKKSNKGSLDISDMVGIVKPVLGDKQASTLDGMQSMMGMMNLMSSLNLTDTSDPEGTKKSSNLDMKSVLSMINMMSNLGVGPLVGGSKGSGLNPNDLLGIMNKLGNKTRTVDKDKIIEISEYDEEDFLDGDQIEGTL